MLHLLTNSKLAEVVVCLIWLLRVRKVSSDGNFLDRWRSRRIVNPTEATASMWHLIGDKCSLTSAGEQTGGGCRAAGGRGEAAEEGSA